MHPAAWHPDPTGRHQFRYWDGAAWTEHVADDGVTSSDTLDTTEPAATHSGDADVSLASLSHEVTLLRREVARLTQLLVDDGGVRVAAQHPSQEMPAVLSGANGRNTVATASAVIGSIALITAFVPVFGVLGVIAGIGAIILGAVGRTRAKEYAQGSGAALAGIITGSLAAAIGIIVTIVLVVTLNSSTFLEEYREYVTCIEETDDADACAEPFENGDLFRFLG